ncbi:hypothetical protein M3Y94_00495800 [Aphelenchoides besseyi]|nr:hypothetical protein M3Y94_00495800 [Aphelenchoides besseyi]KAI6217157.1 hypothetical protein M3Y95_01239000 [Aphelenchoides besseyi]
MSQPPSFFNPTNHGQADNSEVNWAQLAQRWMSERAAVDQQPSHIPPNFAPSPYLQRFPVPQQIAPRPIVPVANHQSNYGSFFLPPPTRHSAAPPIHQHGRFPPRPSHFSPYEQPHIPTQYAPYSQPPMPNHSWPQSTGLPPIRPPIHVEEPRQERPLFQSHATAKRKNSIPKKFDDDEQCPEGVMAHWLRNFDPPPGQESSTAAWMRDNRQLLNSEPNSIDQKTRKKLPPWILEGLEKAEKEKQKKLEKEMAEQKAADEEAKRNERRQAKGLGKFDSDSEDEDKLKEPGSSSYDPAAQTTKLRMDRKRKGHEIDSQEFEYNEMLAVKRLVTSVLLSASDQSLDQLVRGIVHKNRREGKFKFVAKKSTALAALSSIADYSDEDE